MNLIRTVLLDQANALVLDVARHNPGKRPAQVGGQLVSGHVVVQLQFRHVLVSRVERVLEAFLDLQQPVEVKRVISLAAELLHFFQALSHLPGDVCRVVDDDLVMTLRFFTQRGTDESVQLLQVRLGIFRTGQDYRERYVLVVRVHQNAKQIEELFSRAGATGEDDDAVANAHEGFETFFDVRQDHQLVDDRVGCFGRNDARLGQAQIATADNALLGVGNSRALHRAFHYARAAASADIQAAQAQFMADFLGVFVFFSVDRVTTPAHHHLRLYASAQRAGIAQQVEHVIGDALRIAQVDALAVQFAFGVNDVTQGAEQHLAGAGDHFTIDKRIGRSVEQLQAHTAILLMNSYFKAFVRLKNGLGVIDVGASIENGQGALAKQGVGAA
ncbi:Uncharacterized protein ALO35_05778 [Pseudomonas amygdali pv. lachrymans]|uniref:Uncharacterized protein n=1 Tax=Pseudomonas amygdali pv. lachrymans TaxID=53707 RepID=A0A0N8RRM3_PSEAV|nr:Uncharacterized protein ALO35_05778 [Pseudomonas amygdali pv. lachrymans]